MQDKGGLCQCGCGLRKPNRKRRYFPGHSDRTANRIVPLMLEREKQHTSRQWRIDGQR